MTVTQVGTPATPAIASASNTMSVAGTFGTGQNVSGDLQVALVTAWGTTTATIPSTVTAGWRQVGAGLLATKAAVAIWMAYGKANAPTFTSTGTGSATEARITCELIDLHDPGGYPVLDTFGTAGGTVSPLTVTTSGNVTGAGEYALSVYATGSASSLGSGTWTKGTSWTEITDTFTTTTYAHSAFDEYSGPPSGSTLAEAVSWSLTTTFAAGMSAVFKPPAAVLAPVTTPGMQDALVMNSAALGQAIARASQW